MSASRVFEGLQRGTYGFWNRQYIDYLLTIRETLNFNEVELKTLHCWYLQTSMLATAPIYAPSVGVGECAQSGEMANGQTSLTSGSTQLWRFVQQPNCGLRRYLNMKLMVQIPTSFTYFFWQDSLQRLNPF